MRLIDDEMKILEVIIGGEVIADDDFEPAYGNRTKGDFSRASLEIIGQSVLRLKPEPVVLDKANVGDRATTDLSSDIVDFVEG